MVHRPWRFTDAIHYHPLDEYLIAYKDDCYLLMNASVDGTPGISSWSTGHKDESGHAGSWLDAANGLLDEAPSAFGSIFGAIAADSPTIGAGSTAVVHTWLAAGKNLQQVRFLDSIVRRRGPQYFMDRTLHYWRAWVNKEDLAFANLPPEVVRMYKRSLLILRTQVDNGGGITAANDSDYTYLVHGRETYSYVWPRDGAYIANALDKAGYAYLATQFYEFCSRVIYYETDPRHDDMHQEKAYMLHKYTPDGKVASNWMAPQVDEDGVFRPPIQEDETALIPYSLWQHYLIFRDVEVMKPWFRPLIIHTANFMCGFRDRQTGLPAPSFDLWEERRGIYSYTSATVWAGLTAAANMAELFGEYPEARRFRDAANEIKAACETHLYDENERRFLKSIVVAQNGTKEPDYTVDASLYGLWYFGMFDPTDPRIVRTMDAVVDRLTCRTEIGGLARYEGDLYHWDQSLDDRREDVAGNPWFITTLWMAQYEIAKAKDFDELKRAIPALEWVCARALPSGVLAEQIHPVTGGPMSVSPLTWSHATVVATVQEYVRKHSEMLANLIGRRGTHG